MNLYHDSGYPRMNLVFEDKAPFCVCVGGRGIGKTFGALDYLIAHNIPFIYMRRTQAQIDACKIPELNPFKALNRVKGTDIVASAIGKSVAGFYHGENVDGKVVAVGKPVAIGFPLSTFSNIRGIDASDYDVLLFDEVIPEPRERPIADESGAFLNAVETISRNRELDGRPPLKVVLLSNSNDLKCGVLDAIGAQRPLDKMAARGREYGTFHGGALAIYRFRDSPISERKRHTALYQVANNKDFRGMALDNSFNAETYRNVVNRPLVEYVQLASCGGVTVCRHKGNGSYYVIEGESAPLRYNSAAQGVKAFKAELVGMLPDILALRVEYSSAVAKAKFELIMGV